MMIPYYYNEGRRAYLKGLKYNDNPHAYGSSEHLSWSKGHNVMRVQLINIKG